MRRIFFSLPPEACPLSFQGTFKICVTRENYWTRIGWIKRIFCFSTLASIVNLFITNNVPFGYC